MRGIVIDSVYVFSWVIKSLILVRFFFMLVPKTRTGRFSRLVFMLTEPVLSALRAVIKKSPLGGPGIVVDMSPVFGYFLVEALAGLVSAIIRSV